MKNSFAPFAAILSVLAFFTWMLTSAPDEQAEFEVDGSPTTSIPTSPTDVPALRDQAFGLSRDILQDQTVGSRVPCAVPLVWRIARVDGEFGLSQGEARAVLEQATTLWEEAVGSGLFLSGTDGNLPVRFLYDERQERTLGRSDLVRDFNDANSVLEARRVELDERIQQNEVMRGLYDATLRDFEQRVASRNDSIRDWNARDGGAPEDVVSKLQRSGRALDAERAALMARGREVDELQRRLAEDSESFDQEVESLRREGEGIGAEFPVTSAQAGAYREAVHTRGGEVASVTREIRIYLEGLDDLVRVAAHELGHALGLGHNANEGSVMAVEFTHTLSSQGTLIQRSDVEALQALCPEL